MTATRLSLELAVLATLIGRVRRHSARDHAGRPRPRLRRILAAVIATAIAFPGLLLALFVNTIIGIGAIGAVLGIGIATIPGFARLAQTLSASVAGLDYVAAARILGVSRARILFRHVLPNVAEPLIMTATMSVGWSLLGISALSFLGLGVRPPSYDWGALLGSGLQYIYENPLASLGPGAFIVLAGLAFNLSGETLARVRHDAVRQGLSPPRTLGASAASAGSRTAAAPAGSTAPRRRPLRSLRRLRAVGFFRTASGLSHPSVASPSISARASGSASSGNPAAGKSMTVLALAQLLPYPGRPPGLVLNFLGRDLRGAGAPELRRLLGTYMALVFQDPASSLNPGTAGWPSAR